MSVKIQAEKWILRLQNGKWIGDQGWKMKIRMDKCALLSWGLTLIRDCVRLTMSKVKQSLEKKTTLGWYVILSDKSCNPEVYYWSRL